MTEEPQVKPPHPITLAFVCVGAFIGALLLFTLAVIEFATRAGNYWPGFVLCVLGVVALFVARKRGGPSPLLSAVAVGVTAALVIVGTCLAIVHSMNGPATPRRLT